jgi:quinol monooxygenase YgiN
MIYVIATIQLHPGKRESFLEEFHRLVPKVKAERGCLEYGPAVDTRTGLPSEAPHREDVVTIIEKWESLDALKTHLAANMAEYRKQVRDFVVNVGLQVLEPA